MTKFTGEEFVKALTSEHGIPASVGPLHLVGMVKASPDGETNSVLFTSGGACVSWTPIPVKMIQSVEHLGKVPCRDHEHDFVRLHVKPATTDEGRVLSAILRQMQIGGAQGDYTEDTQERWGRPRWRPPRLPPFSLPPLPIPGLPGFGRRINQDCVGRILGFAIAGTGCGAAIAMLESGAASPTVVAGVCGVAVATLVQAVEACS